MKILALILLLSSHVPIVWPCLRAMKRRVLPRSIDLVGLSFLLYFDVEIGFEAFGGRYTNEYFRGLFSSSVLGLVVGLLLIAPWAMKFGYVVASDLIPTKPPINVARLKHARWFYWTSAVICLAICACSAALLIIAPSIWAARVFVGAMFGPLVILLYIPIGILGFYVRQPESRTRKGKVFTGFLLILSVLATVPIGERTLMLLPVLVVAVFAGKPSLAKFLVTGTVLLISAVILLQFTKLQQSEGSARDLAASVFTGDIARGPVLAATLDHSKSVGTRVMSYPGAGYVYAMLLYVPRVLAPFKGDSTGVNFTARMTTARASDVHWVLAIGVVDELALNFGWIFVIPGLFIYGFCFYLLDRASITVPVLRVATLLAAIWVAGYDLAALLNAFGAIALFGGTCHFLFVKTEPRLMLRLNLGRKHSYRFEGDAGAVF